MCVFIIPEEKFTHYALNMCKEPNKARAFKEALDFTVKNYHSLIWQIRQLATLEKMRKKGYNAYGELFEQVMEVSGKNGKTAAICTGWIRKSGESDFYLTSVYVTRKKVSI